MSDWPEPEFDGLDPWKCAGCNEWRDSGPTRTLRINDTTTIEVCVWCWEDEFGPLPDEPSDYGVPF